MELISDSEFMALLVSRTSGRIMQILGARLGNTQNWGMVRSEIISTLASYVLEWFQSSGEDLNSYAMSVVASQVECFNCDLKVALIIYQNSQHT